MAEDTIAYRKVLVEYGLTASQNAAGPEESITLFRSLIDFGQKNEKILQEPKKSETKGERR